MLEIGGLEEVKLYYVRAIRPLNLPKIVPCNQLSEAQFAVVCDRVLLDWATITLLVSEARAIEALVKLKSDLKDFSAIELAQHWKALAEQRMAVAS